MTKEQAIEVLRCNTNLGYGIVIENESTQLIKEAIEMAIKALEQQPSDDCVSRQAVLHNAYAYGYSYELEPEGYCVDVEDIQALPLVTPTHGTCKDCGHCGAYSCGYSCYKGHWSKISKESNYGGMGDFYCADFEKRGSEDV